MAAEAERVMDQMARGDTFLTDVVGKKARSAVKPRHDQSQISETDNESELRDVVYDVESVNDLVKAADEYLNPDTLSLIHI